VVAMTAAILADAEHVRGARKRFGLPKPSASWGRRLRLEAAPTPRQTRGTLKRSRPGTSLRPGCGAKLKLVRGRKPRLGHARRPR